MIEVEYKDRLGNNLFQYALGRILATELGFELSAAGLRGFPNTWQPVSGLRHTSPVERITGHLIDLEAILRNRAPRHVVLDGWFQHWRYYRPYRADIRRWLAFDPAIRVPEQPLDLVANVRRTDYVQAHWALPFSYYETAIDALLPPGGQLHVATDDPGDPFFLRFRRWRPKFLVAGPLETLAAMAGAKRLVISQSTFGWWGTFLATREDQAVACPAPLFGCWSKKVDENSPDLVEHDRFFCIPCTEPYRPNQIEHAYQKWRRLKRRGILYLNRRYYTGIRVPPQ